jgi:hypothetical protein
MLNLKRVIEPVYQCFISSNLNANTSYIYDTLKVKSNDKEMIFTLHSKRETKHNLLTRAQILPTQIFPRTGSVLPIFHAVTNKLQ